MYCSIRFRRSHFIIVSSKSRCRFLPAMPKQLVGECSFIREILFCQRNYSLTTRPAGPRVVAFLAAREALDSSESAHDESTHGPVASSSEINIACLYGGHHGFIGTVQE